MSLLFNKVKKTKSENYVRYSFDMIQKKNIKEGRKIFIKYQANIINVHIKQLLYKTLS